MGGSGSVWCVKKALTLFALEPGPKLLRDERKSEVGGNKNPPSLVLPLNDDAHAHADDNSTKGGFESVEDDGVG